ncbi:MAG: reverse transcriptase family protein, partial [Sarcina sp.]
MNEISDTYGLKDTFRTLFPNDVGYTRIDNKVRTRIDRIYVSSTVKIINYKTEYLVDSDHLAVAALISVNNCEKKGYWKLNVTCLKNNEMFHDLTKEINRIKDLKVLTKSSIELWNIFKRQVTFFLKHKCKYLKQQKNEYYNTLVENYIELQTKENKGEEDEYQLSKVKAEMTEINDEVFLSTQIHAGCNTKFTGNPTSVIRQLKKRREEKHIKGIRDNTGNIVLNEREKRETIMKMCSEAAAKVNIERNKITDFLKTCPKLTKDNFQHLESPINKEEIIEAILQLNDGKSPGPDGLPAEFYKTCMREILDLLTDMYNEGIQKGKFDETFYHSVISLIYKKGDPYELDNWRQISLLNLDYKILAKIMMNRMNATLNKIIDVEQTCAIKGRYMWDNLATVREIITDAQNKEYFIVGLDQKKAFDYISREYLWDVMDHYGFPNKFIGMIKT